MSTVLPVQIEAVHLALFVEEMPRSVAFYSVLFGIEPAKQFDDYAKFALNEPPAVFSLQPGRRRAGASLSHMGLRLRTPEQVLQVQQRLVDAGYSVSRQDGVTCGYALQSKCWVYDPDGNPWEIYVLEQDVEPATGGACLTQIAPGQGDELAGDAVELDLENPADALISDSGPVAGLKLSGWPRAGVVNSPQEKLLTGLFGRLTSGGRVRWQLTVSVEESSPSDEATDAEEAVPLLHEAVDVLERGGLTRILVESLVPRANATGLCRVKLSAMAPMAPAETDTGRTVLYRGPMARLIDANGRTWLRGVRSPVSEAEWHALRTGHLADHFSFAEAGAAPMCSSGD